uniref:TIL domain-containing protein n=1 Tax=Strongyloides stercoralis TaxID=6248 RepID=A0A0K0E7M0_STRER
MFSNNFYFFLLISTLFLSRNILTRANPVSTSPEQCQENEIYMECGPCNEARCYTIYFFVDPCRFNKCSPPGCYCADGYGRKGLDDNTCTLLSTCKDKSSLLK